MSARRSYTIIIRNTLNAIVLAVFFFLALGLLGAGDNVAPVSGAPAAASIGPNFAGTATSATWTSPSNATGANDTLCATDPGIPFATIDLTNFSFSIPTGAVITGIRVEPDAGCDGVVTFSAQLLKAGTPVGIAKGFVPPAACAFTSLGSTGDLWGTTWTTTDINATKFGLRITSGNSQTVSSLDAVRITILFDPPPVPSPTPARPAEVPEADTLLLVGGGLGGLATWLAWQHTRFARKIIVTLNNS